jgi:ribosomal protein L25 (general stress protein Ctc)
MVSNDNFYQSFRNQLSKINTQISKLLYYLVFNCAWIYFIYVYVNQVFTFFSLTNTKAIPNKAIGARAEDFLKLLFMNTAGSAGTLVDHKREQFISFILIALLVIEKKIIEAVSKNLDLMKEDNEDQFDCEKCATNILAHLDLYISVRENAASAAKAKKGQAQGNEGPADHPSNIKVASSIDFLKRKINDSIKNSKMQELLAQEESKRTLNSNLFQRLSEGDQLDDISNKQKIRLCLHEKTSYLDKVIFFNVIKNKFSFAQVQYALMHNMQRAGIIFLMTIVTFSPTVINVLLLLIIFFLEIRNKSFSEELSTLCLVSCIFILKDDLLMMLSFSQSLKTQIDSYKFILYYNQKVVYFSTAFLLICNIFMLIAIGLTKSILIGLNTHKLPKLKIFWMFVVKKKSGILRNVRLHVDHKKWVSAGNSLLLTVRNLLYVYPLEIYLIIMIIIPLLMFERVTPYVMGFIAFPYLISFIQFKERGTKAKIERFFFKYFILLCWVTLLIFYPLTTLLPSKDVGEIFSPTLLKVEFTLPLAILINQTYKEFMATEDYEDTQLKLQKQRVLISSLINYCYTYDYNERKLRENINIFVKQRHVIECTEKISNLGENEDLNFDEKIVDNLFSYDENLLPIIFQKCTTFERLRIKFYTFMYSFMLAFNYESIFESVFYLYTTFKHKNRNVISSTTGLDLNQFLKLESDMMIENIKQAEQFYLRLKEKDIDSLKRFEEELIKIKDKISYTSKIDRSKSSQLRESIGQSEIREASDQKGKSPTEIYGLESSRVDLKPEDDASRKKIDHEKAANAIFDRLNGPKMTKTNKNDIFDFPIGAHMNSKKIDKLIFHNIQPYFIEQTNYFTKFDYMVFLKLILGILLSNMEILIIMMMTMVHIWAGGVYAIIIFTIVFFILIEERPGQYKLWLMIDSIYLLVLIIIFTITNNYNFIVVTQGENKKRNMLPSEQSAELVLLFLGKMDSQYGICIIFFLIILLRINFEKLGFYNKSIMGVETLPMAVHRIIINEDFYEVFDKEIEKKKLRVQAVEDLVLKKFKENQSSFL